MSQPDVLIAEDERAIATLLAALVRECGAEPRVVHDGGEALRAMLLSPPDLLLLDLIMPVMGGEEVLAEMAAQEPLRALPVIVITTRETMLGTPPREVIFLRKPFQPAEVKQLVRQALGLECA